MPLSTPQSARAVLASQGITPPKTRGLFVFSVMACLFLALLSTTWAEEPAKRNFDLPADNAEAALRRFAVQSGCQVIFPTDLVDGIRTSAVRGEFPALDALSRMLSGTLLRATVDPATGAVAIIRDNPPPARQKGGDLPRAKKTSPTETKTDTPKMKKPFTLLATLATFFTATGHAQVAPSAPTDPANSPRSDAEEVVILSPFVVNASEDKDAYRATSTLAGTRVRTELKDIASAISVVTAEFLRDTGATNNQTLLQYTPNTEVGGIYGNYAGVGNTFVSGISEGSNLINPNANTRVRGLDSADNTRDYFLSDIPWDSYNVGRVDLQRGPNSILFGIGSPAGIVNASINTAGFENSTAVENRVGSYGTVRNSLDINRVLLKDELALRVSALDDNTKYRQKPAYNHSKRLFGALRYDPKLFKTDSAHTTIRVNFERGTVVANNPRVLPPSDRLTAFFGGETSRTAYDGYWSGQEGGVGIAQYEGNKPPLAGVTPNYWITQFAGVMADGPNYVYDNLRSPSAAVQNYMANQPTYFGIGTDGKRDGGINGGLYGSSSVGTGSNGLGLGGYSDYARNKQKQLGNVAGVEAADKGFYKTLSISDPTIFDFYNNLIDGPNKIEKQGWTAYNVSLEQTFLDGRIGVQAVYDRQKYNDFSEANMSDPFITIDIGANARNAGWSTAGGVTTYNGTGTAGTNPNAGRAFTSGTGHGSQNVTDRETFRVTLMGEVKATDFLSKSWLTDLLGRHVFTGLFAKDTYDRFNKNWMRYGDGVDFGEVTGFGGGGNPELGNNTNSKLNGGNRSVGWMTYLSEPLFNRTSAHGINLQPITTQQTPGGMTAVVYFDSHWKWSLNPSDPNYVDPAAEYIRKNVADASQSNVSTQSENPANYVGWRTVATRILNADQGDRDALTTDATKIRKSTDSKALTWQGYLWDDMIVPTFGWRRDTQKQRSGASTNDLLDGRAGLNFDLNPLDPAIGVAKGETRSWGVVLHEPKFLRDKLPLGTNFSVFYNRGENTRVENRYGFSGTVLPNAKGSTKDYGVVMSTLNDRLQLKVTWYKTEVKDANLSSVSTGASTLGDYQYEISSLEGWGTASALMDLAGFAGKTPGQEWYWNHAYVDHNSDPIYQDPTSAAFLNDPSTIKEKAAVASWLSQMQPQSWYDAFGIPVNVAKAAAGDYSGSVAGWDAAAYGYITGVNPAGGNKVNGSYPTGTVNNESKGIEFELIGQVAKNWNISVNASKQTASQTALGQEISSFIEAQHAKFESPAGDLRLWWGGDKTLREYYNSGPWAAYLFQKETSGKMVAEMSPWRFNLVTNYSFDRGFLKNVNIGGGYRWQQGVILGYMLNDAKDNIDVNRPYWGKSLDSYDLWIGYSRKLTSKIDWRIQVNIRQLGEKAHLEAISIQPDGSPANFRINSGQAWTVTNTFSF